jgi:hypothetical protein
MLVLRKSDLMILIGRHRLSPGTSMPSYCRALTALYGIVGLLTFLQNGKERISRSTSALLTMRILPIGMVNTFTTDMAIIHPDTIPSLESLLRLARMKSVFALLMVEEKEVSMAMPTT